MLAAGVTSAAGLSLAFAGDGLTAFIDVHPHVAALIFLMVIALLSARGIKESMSANIVMTFIDVSGLLLVVFAVVCYFNTSAADMSRGAGVQAGR